MPKARYLTFIWIACFAAVANILGTTAAKAAHIAPSTITPQSETQDYLIFDFRGIPYLNEIQETPHLVFNGQYWNIFSSRYVSTGPEASPTKIYIQQDSSGSTSDLNGVFDANLPTALFTIDIKDSTPYTREASYFANAPVGEYGSITCPASSPECVFYTLTAGITPFPIPGVEGWPADYFRLKADYQPSASSENVPEPLTIAGSVLALGLGKRFLSKSKTKRQSAKTV